MKKFFAGCALAALATSNAYAQSTGTVDLENKVIVVTGATNKNGVSGVVVPTEPKARATLTQEFIGHKAAGQSILETINQIPGVNFTNNDAYGSSGGNVNIRGFDGARVALTFDGIPLNDTGNYAQYSNQQLDPELIDQVSVNLGATDVDSPTAAASGGTIAYRTVNPTSDFGAILKGSLGSFRYGRVFGMINTGEFTKFGTRAWFAASDQEYHNFKGYGQQKKQQYNFKVYQPIGGNGDFVSVAGNWNKNRNQNYLTNTVSDTFTYPQSDYAQACARPTPGPGAQVELSSGNVPGNCGSQTPVAASGGTAYGYYGAFVNPSNTGNIRINSRFTLNDKLTLTVDPSWQYTLADGGSQTTTLSETSGLLRGSATTGGVDLNGDGDLLDTVRVMNPSITNTNRYGVLASLIYKLSDHHRFRLGYSLDYGVHRQTGEYGFLTSKGDPVDVFGGRNGPAVLDTNGQIVQRRNRRSIAELNQVSGEYRGTFGKLSLNVGVRAPFFTRKLDQRCYTNFTGSSITVNGVSTSSLGVLCTSFPVATGAANQLTAPFKVKYKYNKVLPNIGANYDLDGHNSLFASFSKGLSVPRTDNLYSIAPGQSKLAPETTSAFDVGYRYRSSKIQASLNPWYIRFKNRIIQSYDRDSNTSVDTNIGGVKAWGVDASLAYRPIKAISLYGFGSYKKTRVDDNSLVQSSSSATIFNLAGKQVVDSPQWLYGGRAEVNLHGVTAGIDVKHTSKRYVTYINDSYVPGYTVANLDVRVSLKELGLNDKTFFQFNVINLFDKFYVSSIPSTTVNGTGAFVNRAAPRTLMGTVQIGF